MASEDNTQDKVVVAEAKPDIVVVSKEQSLTPPKAAKDAANAKNNSSNNTTASSQQQLLSLAKSFSIEGGLLPVEKQMPIADRASKRDRLIIQRQQHNLETIIAKAISYCDDENAVNKADQDWFSSFIPLAENISNQTMQGLWAKILAGEISKPGSFSLKALTVFRNMSIRDAKQFAKICTLACHENPKKNYRIIFGASQQPSLFNLFDQSRQQLINLNTFGVSYGDILALAENNLIFSQETETSLFEKGHKLVIDYNGMPLEITAIRSNTVLSFYKFTPAGTELARLINDAPEMDYLHSLKSQLSHHFSIQTKASVKE
ncbi:MAG: TIGR03899 family protein [Thalassotalea sp.]